MENDKTNSAVDEFLGDLKNNDGDEVFEAASENPFDEVIESKEEIIEKPEDKPVPFNKDPKVLKFIEKEVAKKLADFTPQRETKQEFVENAGDEIDEVLTRIIGNDTPEKVSAIKDFKKILIAREEAGAEKALRELDNRQQAEIQAEQEAEQELEAGFESIEDTFNVDITSNTPQARKTRKEFIEFIEKIAPKDENGEIRDYPDFEETFKLFQEKNKPQPNYRARDIASRGMTRTSDASNMPVERDYSWNGVERFFSKLSK